MATYYQYCTGHLKHLFTTSSNFRPLPWSIWSKIVHPWPWLHKINCPGSIRDLKNETCRHWKLWYWLCHTFCGTWHIYYSKTNSLHMCKLLALMFGCWTVQTASCLYATLRWTVDMSWMAQNSFYLHVTNCSLTFVTGMFK
jgi:hypothetical protein